MRQCSLILLLCSLSFPLFGSEQQALILEGEYLTRAAGCISCHTDHDNKGAYLAGGRALKTPFGIFYTPNITPDQTYGIGNWSEQDLQQALRHGISPAGKSYYPVFPYTSYTKLTQQDIHAMAVYLRSIKAVAAQNKEHETKWYLFRWVIAIWQELFFQASEFKLNPDKDESFNRGNYLVAIGHCSECHTPRNDNGVLDASRYLSGNKNGPEDEAIPNITPHRKTGIGRWSQSDLVYFLKSGELPDGDYSGSLMAEVIDDSTRYLTDSDRQSIASYLRSLQAIENLNFVKKAKKKIEEEW